MAKAGPSGPNTKLAMAAIVLILIGVGWGIYTANPGNMIRAKTKEELTQEKDEKKEADRKARDAERIAKKRGGPAH